MCDDLTNKDVEEYLRKHKLTRREFGKRGAGAALAMMLPPVAAVSPEGLAAYVDTPQLTDRSNRGEATAERRERITYLVEGAGHFVIPEQVFHWWDTGSGELREAVLPELVLEAGGAPANTAPADSRIARWQPASPWLAIPVVLLAMLMLFRNLHWRFEPGEGRQLRRVNRALRKGEDAEAARLLYSWLNSRRPGPDWMRLRRALSHRLDTEALARLEGLLESAYSADVGQDHSRDLTIERPGLWKRFRGYLERWSRPSQLEFNPGSSAGERKAFSPR